MITGPKSVDVARQILRPTFEEAGKESIHLANTSVQSDLLFETFNYTPVPNQELGIDNPLAELNTQREFIRFNPTHELFQPRAYSHPDTPHPLPPQWQDTHTPEELGGFYIDMFERRAAAKVAQSELTDAGYGPFLENRQDVVPLVSAVREDVQSYAPLRSRYSLRSDAPYRPALKRDKPYREYLDVYHSAFRV